MAAGVHGDMVVLGGSEPTWRQYAAKGFWSEWLDDDTLYVNWRTYEGLADEGFELIDSFTDRSPKRLIVDLRDNRGGDYTIGRAFVERIRNLPQLNRKNALYVLIGRQTFSAAMTNAADFHTNTNAELVGEPAGAAPNNWQEVRRFVLPHSKLGGGVSTRYYEFLPGRSTLDPDQLVVPRPDDWGTRYDAAIQLILDRPLP